VGFSNVEILLFKTTESTFWSQSLSHSAEPLEMRSSIPSRDKVSNLFISIFWIIIYMKISVYSPETTGITAIIIPEGRGWDTSRGGYPDG